MFSSVRDLVKKDEPVTFAVQVDGLNYPFVPRTDARIGGPWPADRLLQEIVHNIWPTLLFVDREVEGFDDVKDVVESYSASWSRLESCWQELQHLVETVGSVNLEFHAENGVNETARNQEIEKTLAQSRDTVASGWNQPETPLKADLVEKPLDEVQAALRTSLWEATHSLASQALDLLNRLVNEQRIGLIRWAGASSCEIHFFREIILQRNNNTVEIVGRKSTQIIHTSDLQTIRRTTTETTTVTTSEHEHRIARHEMHLMNAESKLLEHTTTVIPAEFHPLVQAIPAWLRPMAEVVDGTRFRHLIVSKPISVGLYRDEQTRIEHQDVIVHPDPAILLGNRYVLAGWGPEEEAVEVERQAAVVQKESERSVMARQRGVAQAWKWLMIAFVVQVFGLVLGAGGAATYSTIAVFGWLVSLLGLIPLDEAVRTEAAARRVSAGREYRFYTAASATILAFGFQFLAAAYVQNSWPMAIAGLLLGGLAVPSIYWAWRARG